MKDHSYKPAVRELTGSIGMTRKSFSDLRRFLMVVSMTLTGVFTPILVRAQTATVDASSSLMDQYRLGSGDKVQITTFGEPSLSGAFDVSGSGMVAFPLAGEIQAKGLTAPQFGHAVEAALRDGFLKDPKVSVEVINYRPLYMLVEVTRPGEYPYTNGLTVLNAVATANGFTYRADTHHVFIKRANEKAEHQVNLDTTTTVEPGDTIRIKERYF